MKEHQNYHFQVNLGGMLDILSNHLYTSPDVFVRELLQNGVDAVTMRTKRQPEWNEGMIHITVEPGERMVFCDNGAGLTEEEIHRFLAVIGQSSKTEMINGKIPEDFIGRFGIGLLSCFMVSDTIVVHTRSVDSNQAYTWEGRPDGTYSLTPAQHDCPVGTSIVLTAREGAEDYFQPERIEQLVCHYGLYLPVPIYLGDSEERLNKIPENFASLSRSTLLNFGSWLFNEEFLDAIPIHTSHLCGVAYILPFSTNQALQDGHRIYLKQMLLTESGDRLLPPWAFFLRCVLNTTSLRPTASREDFYEDDQLELAREEFAQTVRTYLKDLSVQSPQRMTQLMKVHLHAIKSMAVWDEQLFELFIDYLPFETSEGEMTGAGLKKAKSGFWVDSVPKFKELRPIFSAQGKLLICTGYTNDLELVQRLDDTAQLDLKELDEGSMELVLEEVTATEQREAALFLQTANEVLAPWDCQAALARFFPTDLTVLYTMGERAEFVRRVQTAQEMSSGVFSQALASFLDGLQERPMASVYFNANNPLVRRLCMIKQREMLKNTIEILYTQALLAGGHHLQGGELRTMNRAMLSLLDDLMDLSQQNKNE